MRVLTGGVNYGAYQMQPYPMQGPRNTPVFTMKDEEKKIDAAATVEISSDSKQLHDLNRQRAADAVLLYGNHSEEKSLEEMLETLDEDSAESDTADTIYTQGTYLRCATVSSLLTQYQKSDDADYRGSSVDTYV